MQPCPVCGDLLPGGLKTHVRCWEQYVEWRDTDKRVLYDGRLWPEDGGTWLADAWPPGPA
jgi:hypothetical protein